MQSHIGLTPFGSQRMTHALMAAHQKTKRSTEDATIDKWQLYRWLCEGKSLIGLSDRTLAVLSALLSFHPENNLNTRMPLVVFPSNKQLSLRAHGMADATLRRHLAALVEAGLITRQDSPNGKRYARRSKSGELRIAFGFSLEPLLTRASEFEAAADRVKAEKLALRELREQLTLLRRDISKILEYGIEENLPGEWMQLKASFRSIVDAIPRRAEQDKLKHLIAALMEIHVSIDKLLKNNEKSKKTSANASHIERQLNESKPDSISKHNFAEFAEKETIPFQNGKSPDQDRPITIDQILQTYPEVETYALDPIKNWRDLSQVTSRIRCFLGIDTKLYELALENLGKFPTAIVICYLLQRYEHIRSTSGYLRILIEKAQNGAFSVQTLIVSGQQVPDPTKGLAICSNRQISNYPATPFEVTQVLNQF